MDDVDCLFDDLRCTVVDHRIWIGDARNFDTLPLSTSWNKSCSHDRYVGERKIEEMHKEDGIAYRLKQIQQSSLTN